MDFEAPLRRGHRRAGGLIACACALVATGASTANGILPSAAATLKLRAVADASTRSDRPRSTDGRARRLVVQADRPRRVAFLRFALPARPGRVVNRATLRVRVIAARPGTVVALRPVARTGWKETRLAWRHQPRMGRAVDRAAHLTKRSWAAFDATRVVRAARGGRVAMALTVSSHSGSASFVSRNGRASRPRLVVETTPAALAPPGSQPTGSPPSPAGSGRYAWRGMYDRQADGGFSTIAAAGINLIDSGPGTVDDLTAGLKGMVWVGDYSSSCTWEVSDAQLRSYVTAHIADPKVGVWFISDEPDPSCPNAFADHAARSALIHSIDPNAKTLTVVDANSGQATLDQIPKWKGTADIIGLDPYVCWQGQACHYAWIDTVANTATSAGLNFWGVVQAFGDPAGGGYSMCTVTFGCGKARLPTPDELHQQFVSWRASPMTGYLAFAWRWPSSTSSLWLANHPELQTQLATEAGT